MPRKTFFWVFCGLFSLTFISTAHATNGPAFPIPIDPSDEYISTKLDFSRMNGRIICGASEKNCLAEPNGISFPATGNPVCMTGSFGPYGPWANDMFATASSFADLIKNDTYCWDRATSNRLIGQSNITQINGLDSLDIVIEPEIPDQ